MSPDLQSTIGRELRENYALQLMDELQFVKILTTDQPFVPKYFGADVMLNKQGAPAFKAGIDAVPTIDTNSALEQDILVIDTRPKQDFRNGHIKGAINLQDGGKFETWLGSVVGPDELFYLIAANEEALDIVIKKSAKIGYEQNIKATLLLPEDAFEKLPDLDLTDFVHYTENYTVIDVRNHTETAEGLIFKSAITIPLPELRERLSEIPTNKPIVVHCAAGYRSAAAVSIISGQISNVPVYDLGEAVVEMMVNS
jgi:rhodanese-related sulfurtransferase